MRILKLNNITTIKSVYLIAKDAETKAFCFRVPRVRCLYIYLFKPKMFPSNVLNNPAS